MWWKEGTWKGERVAGEKGKKKRGHWVESSWACGGESQLQETPATGSTGTMGQRAAAAPASACPSACRQRSGAVVQCAQCNQCLPAAAKQELHHVGKSETDNPTTPAPSPSPARLEGARLPSVFPARPCHLCCCVSRVLCEELSQADRGNDKRLRPLGRAPALGCSNLDGQSGGGGGSWWV